MFGRQARLPVDLYDTATTCTSLTCIWTRWHTLYCWLRWPCKFKAGSAVHLVVSNWVMVPMHMQQTAVVNSDHNSIRNPPSAQHFPLWICKANAISSIKLYKRQEEVEEVRLPISSWSLPAVPEVQYPCRESMAMVAGNRPAPVRWCHDQICSASPTRSAPSLHVAYCTEDSCRSDQSLVFGSTMMARPEVLCEVREFGGEGVWRWSKGVWRWGS